MHWFEHVSEIQFLHIGVNKIVGFSYPLFKSCLERKLCHNRCYEVWLFLLHLYKYYLCVWMEHSMIVQLVHSNGIFIYCHDVYIILFRLKLYSWILVHSRYFIWALRFHVLLDCMGCCAFHHLWYFSDSFL